MLRVVSHRKRPLLGEVCLLAPSCNNSIVGFDDIPLASYTLPPLTTIYQPSQEMGSLVAKMVMERIKKPNLPIRKEVLLTSLITRKSCQALEEK